MKIFKTIYNLFFKKRTRRVKTFVISDLHYGHANIIKHCSRPFRDVHVMNSTIVRRWNRVVGKNDIVYFLGDFCSGRVDPRTLIKRLNGTIIFIKGNHDYPLHKYNIQPIHKIKFLEVSGEKIMMIHNPHEVDRNRWRGWVIHGHTHNHTEHIDSRRKLLNASCELLNYTPIEIGTLLKRRGF